MSAAPDNAGMAALRAAAAATPPRSPLQIALDLAAIGIPSFPCGANKRPAIPEHEGGHGFHDATADPDALRALFARAPCAKLVGVPTGIRSGIDILDVDPRHDGHLWEADHADQSAGGDRLPDTLIHQTGGGGHHWAFQHAHGVSNRTACPVRGVDVRGEGGYAIWPPSRGYAVINDAAIAPWPDWLLDQVRRPAPVERPAVTASDPAKITDKRLNGLVRALLDRVSRAPEGLKHDTLLRIARTLGGYAHLLDYTEAQLVGLLLDALPDTVEDWKNAEKTALDGLRHGAQSPLTLVERPASSSGGGRERGNGASRDGSGRQTGPTPSLGPGATAAQVPPPPEGGTEGGSGNGGRVPPPDGPGDGPDGPGEEPSDGPDGPGPEWIAGPDELDDANRPTITVVKGLLHRLADEAERAIIDSGKPVYHRGPRLVRPAVTELDAADGGRTHIATLHRLTVPSLDDLFCRTARWQKWHETAKRNVPADPPERVAKILLAREGQWRLPQLRGILSVPTLRHDGSLLDQPGYDEQSRFFLALPRGLHVPAINEEPDQSEAMAALALLDALLDEFPFVDSASRSVALSLLITAVIRAAIPVAPIHAATSPTAGTGKSYLYDIAAAIIYGDRCPVIFAGKGLEELEKKLNGVLLDGRTLFSLDNLNIMLEGDLLAQAAERPLMDLRRLGKSDMILTPNSALVGACGNNLVVFEDMNRRTLMAGLDANMERPETRRFNGNPFKAVLKARGRYVAAALTVVRAYLCDPMGVDVAPLVSYDDYTHFVREPLVWLGRTDPVKSMDALAAINPARTGLAAVMAAWEAAIGLNTPATAATITQNIEHPPVPDRSKFNDNDQWHAAKLASDAAWAALGTALDTASERNGRLTTKSVGNWLGKRRKQIVGGLRFVSNTGHGGFMHWQLARH